MKSRVVIPLFFILLGELFIGGGGRLINVGPISIRMILFALALLTAFILLMQGRRLERKYILLLSVFCVCLVIAIVVGFLNGAPLAAIAEDVKPLLYIFILPFFVFAIEMVEKSDPIIKLVKASALLQSIAFMVVLALIHSKAIPFLTFYEMVLPTKEFFFRGETTFFYKGFVFICAGFIAFALLPSRFKVPLIILLGVAIFLTMTRGFFLALALTFSLYFLMEKKLLRLAVPIALGIVIVVFGNTMLKSLSENISPLTHDNGVTHSYLLGNRDVSDNERVKQIEEVLTATSWKSFFIGHGFGTGTTSRPVHMEISYLEIFHKQGMIGLSLWFFVAYLIFTSYLRGALTADRKFFFFSSAFFFFQSLTNQFINNPIGLSFLLLSFVYLEHTEKASVENAIEKEIMT